MAITPQQKYWETKEVTFASTSIPVKIVTIYGGESVTLKQTATSGQVIYLGNSRDVSANTGYKMENGETVSISLDGKFGKSAFIEIWGLSDSTSNEITYLKVIGWAPETEAT